ncbi:MAG: type II toxin-antitoxin system YafQ family toxin [Ruminococcus sp.]|jgi:addiction module RelE/StbE family toxin
MYTVKFTTAYKKSYKLMKRRGLDLTLLDNVVDTLRQGKQLDAKYHDHELSGKFKGSRLIYMLEIATLRMSLCVAQGTKRENNPPCRSLPARRIF